VIQWAKMRYEKKEKDPSFLRSIQRKNKLFVKRGKDWKKSRIEYWNWNKTFYCSCEKEKLLWETSLLFFTTFKVYFAKNTYHKIYLFFFLCTFRWNHEWREKLFFDYRKYCWRFHDALCGKSTHCVGLWSAHLQVQIEFYSYTEQTLRHFLRIILL
jgi:hypothetical protein